MRTFCLPFHKGRLEYDTFHDPDSQSYLGGLRLMDDSDFAPFNVCTEGNRIGIVDDSMTETLTRTTRV